MDEKTTIYLKNDYRGTRSGNQTIPWGNYDWDDERLMGLRDHLIKMGYAEVKGIPPRKRAASTSRVTKKSLPKPRETDAEKGE